MSMQYGFSFDKGKCVQCYGCEVACKIWRRGEKNVRWRRVSNIWHGLYPEVRNSSLSVSCMHCVDPECVKTCPVDAISKRAEDGIVVVDNDKCIGCKACLESCPFGAPQFGDDGKMQKCDMCLGQTDLSTTAPPCVATCPTKALVLCEMDEGEKLSAEQDVRKMLAG